MSSQAADKQPTGVVLILLDSLNRHLIGPYGGSEFDTPNLDRFAQRALRFTNYRTGSLPCIPARHDIFCGAQDFLWRPWGSIEVWEDAFTAQLREAGVTTKLVSDHPHLFETGGENYHVDFTAWDYQRGGESDPWRTRPDPSWAGAPSFMRGWMPYDNSRGFFDGEDDFPGPRTMAAAARWLDDHTADRGPEQVNEPFVLLVDEFDPHEPFDAPEPYASMYDDDWDGPHLIWPPYGKDVVAGGVIDERQARQIRASYGAKLTMIDHWLGRVLDVLDERDLWDDVAVLVFSDHGLYLGENDTFGKPAVPVRRTLGHIPLLVSWPGVGTGDREALATAVDLHATILDVFGVEPKHRTHGESLVPVITGAESEVRDHVLTGVWGREVQYVDHERMYARAPAGPNHPISLWSNRWSSQILHADVPGLRHLGLRAPDGRAWLDRMPGSDVPVIRQPFGDGDMLPWTAAGEFSGSRLYLADDPDETENRIGGVEETQAAEALRAALTAVDAPDEQLERLGLK